MSSDEKVRRTRRLITLVLGGYSVLNAAIAVPLVHAAVTARDLQFSIPIGLMALYVCGLAVLMVVATARLVRRRPDAPQYARASFLAAVPMSLMLGFAAVVALLVKTLSSRNDQLDLLFWSVAGFAAISVFMLVRVLAGDGLDRLAWAEAEANVALDPALDFVEETEPGSAPAEE